MPSTSALPAWLADAFDSLAAGDIAGWMSVYAPDAVHEFPFAPEGAVRRLEGRAAIETYVTEMLGAQRLRFGSFGNFRVRETGDEVIIEADGHHQRGADGAPVELNYVWFITLRDGKVAYFRDYMNPLQLSSF